MGVTETNTLLNSIMIYEIRGASDINFSHLVCIFCRFPKWTRRFLTVYAHGFVVLCFAVVMQSFIMNSLEVFIHIHQGCFAGTGAIVRLPQCQ